MSTKSNIHPSAIISKEAEIHPTAQIGPFVVIKGKVRIGARSVVESHVVVGSEYGIVEMGEDNRLFSGAMIGGPPQDLKYAGEPTRLVIGNKNNIREFVTVNIGTPHGGGITRIGDSCLLMAYVHVAHDCQFGNNIVIANACNFAGHVTVEDKVHVGGVCCFNQFITIGKYSFIAGDSAVNKDVLPFTMAQGKYAVMRAANKIGLERSGFTKEEIENIHRAIRFIIMGNRTKEEALELIAKECVPSAHISAIVDFYNKSTRGLAR